MTFDRAATSPSSASLPDASRRYLSIDALRIVAALGIVFFHSGIGSPLIRDIYYSGLVCFIIISIVFCIERDGGDLRKRVSASQRLIVPWIFWSGIFLFKDIYLGIWPTFDLHFLLHVISGTSIHLWYLPFLIIATTLITLGFRFLPEPLIRAVAWIGILTVALTANNWRSMSLDLPAPFPQYIHTLFPFFSAIILSFDLNENRYWQSIFVFVLSIALEEYSGLGIPYFVGYLACVLAFCMRHSRFFENSTLHSIAELMFGVYLIHPLFYLPVRKLVDDSNLLYSPAVFSIAVIIVWLVDRGGGPAIRRIFGLRPARL